MIYANHIAQGNLDANNYKAFYIGTDSMGHRKAIAFKFSFDHVTHYGRAEWPSDDMRIVSDAALAHAELKRGRWFRALPAKIKGDLLVVDGVNIVAYVVQHIGNALIKVK